MRDVYFGSHEILRRDHVAKTASDRRFGVVFAGFFAALAAIGLWNGNVRWPIWLGLAVLVLTLTLVVPKVLQPFNWVWRKLGLVLHATLSPMILAILFYACVAPVGFFMRLSGRDPLRQQYKPEADTYWICRIPPGPEPDTFKNQF